MPTTTTDSSSNKNESSIVDEMKLLMQQILHETNQFSLVPTTYTTNDLNYEKSNARNLRIDDDLFSLRSHWLPHSSKEL